MNEFKEGDIVKMESGLLLVIAGVKKTSTSYYFEFRELNHLHKLYELDYGYIVAHKRFKVIDNSPYMKYLMGLL